MPVLGPEENGSIKNFSLQRSLEKYFSMGTLIV
jgi:hypothetical protein